MFNWNDFMNDFPYTNFSDINVSWFLNKFKQVFDEWEGLYNQMLSWKTATDEYNATWRAQQEQAFTTWENNFQTTIDAWKVQTESDIGTWETDTIATLEAWKAVFINQYNALKAEVEQIADDAETAKNSAQASATSAQQSADSASATALALQASLTQINENTNDISDLKTRLTTETTARQSADTTLQNNINAERTRAQGEEARLESLFVTPTQEAVDNWLDEHPEATTTVEDESLTYKKLVPGTLGFVMPEMFGAKGDGVTDDTQALIEAFAYDKILLDNIYKVNNKIIIRHNIEIFGKGTIISPSSISHDELLTFDGNGCENVKIIGITITCPLEILQPTVAADDEHVASEGSVCSNFTAFEFASGVKNVIIKNVNITNMFQAIFYNGDPNKVGFSLFVDSLVSNNYCGEGAYFAYCENVTFINCKFYPADLAVIGSHLFYMPISIKNFYADNIIYMGGSSNSGGFAFSWSHNTDFVNEVFDKTYVKATNSYIRTHGHMVAHRNNVVAVFENVDFDYYSDNPNEVQKQFVTLNVGTNTIYFNNCRFTKSGTEMPNRFASQSNSGGINNIYLNDCFIDVGCMENFLNTNVKFNVYINGGTYNIKNRLYPSSASSNGILEILNAKFIFENGQQLPGTGLLGDGQNCTIINSQITRDSGTSIFNTDSWKDNFAIYNCIFILPVRTGGDYFSSGVKYNNVVVNGELYNK